jgi:hypothetical protein
MLEALIAWFEQSKERFTKWLLLAGAVAVGGHYVIPWLLTLTLHLITLGLLGMIGIALWWTLPALCEAFSLLGWRLWALAIRTDPISRLKKDLLAHAKQLDILEERIAQAHAEVMHLETLIQDSRNTLTESEVAEWAQKLDVLHQAGKELIALRDDEVRKHQDFALTVKKAEIYNRFGQTFTSALKLFSFVRPTGPDSVGAHLALDEVRRQLAASQARLHLVLTRPKQPGPALSGGPLLHPTTSTPGGGQ